MHIPPGKMSIYRSIYFVVTFTNTELLRMHIFPPIGSCPVAGNSVYIDRLFMQRYLPQVDEYLHYRIVDVSSIKELCRYVCLKQKNAQPICFFIFTTANSYVKIIHYNYNTEIKLESRIQY